MKSLLVVLALGFIQICFTSSLVKQATDSTIFSDKHIDNIRNHMETIPDVDPKSIEHFIKHLDYFRENTTDFQHWEGILKLMSLAMNVDYSKLNQTLEEIDSSEENEAENNNQITSEEFDSSEEGFTENQLKKIQAAFSKHFKPAQAAFAMKFFSGMANTASSAESESAFVELFSTAMLRAIGISPSVFNETNAL